MTLEINEMHIIEGCQTLESAWEAFHRVRRETEASLREWPVAPAVRPPEIRRYLADVFTFRDSREAADLVLEVAALLKDGTVHVTHPRYFGLHIPSVRRVCVVAEALAAHFMTRTFGLSTGYMPASTADTLEPYASSLQWSRRFIGLTVFMALAELGEVGVATQIEHQFRMCAWMVRELQARRWDVVNSTPLPVVCFTRTGLPRTESALDQRLAPLLARGQVWITKVSLPGQGWVLRACITSFLTDENDLKILLDELDALRSS